MTEHDTDIFDSRFFSENFSVLLAIPSPRLNNPEQILCSQHLTKTDKEHKPLIKDEKTLSVNHINTTLKTLETLSENGDFMIKRFAAGEIEHYLDYNYDNYTLLRADVERELSEFNKHTPDTPVPLGDPSFPIYVLLIPSDDQIKSALERNIGIELFYIELNSEIWLENNAKKETYDTILEEINAIEYDIFGDYILEFESKLDSKPPKDEHNFN